MYSTYPAYPLTPPLIKGIVLFIDDILIYYGYRDCIFKKVFEGAQEHGVRFNLKKRQFGIKEVIFLGHIFSNKRLKIDNDQIEVITKMRKSDDVKIIESFLGIITYIVKFIPNVSQITVLLRQLTRKNVKWVSKIEHEKTYSRWKVILMSECISRFFHYDKLITPSFDTSKDSLGAVLVHENAPVTDASKALNLKRRR